MTVTIYHNPACGTSRNTLAMIRATGTEPAVIEYLQTPPTRVELQDLVQRMGVPLRDVLRRKGAPYDALGLDDPAVSDDALLDAIAAHPILINRPIVVTPRGVRLCRPSERVLDLLDAIAAHPILINRPVVVTPRGVRLCRPSERVLDLLDAPLPDGFTREDGEPVAAGPS